MAKTPSKTSPFYKDILSGRKNDSLSCRYKNADLQKQVYSLFNIYLTYKSSSLHSIHQYKQSHYTIKIRRNIGD